MKIAVIDNYDSFVYNIIHYLESFDGVEVSVFLNDEIDVSDLQKFDKLVFSPGPGIPSEAGKLLEIINFYKDKKSMLGVCLGHQAIAEYFGCKLINLPKPLHGISSGIKIKNTDYLFKNLPENITVAHYHSWCVSNDNLSSDIEILAIDKFNNIMALRHKLYDIRGVQFHPESVLTPQGKLILENWLRN